MACGQKYAFGRKYCGNCGVFYMHDGMWCPECKRQLRLKPRSSRFKLTAEACN